MDAPTAGMMLLVAAVIGVALAALALVFRALLIRFALLDVSERLEDNAPEPHPTNHT